MLTLYIKYKKGKKKPYAIIHPHSPQRGQTYRLPAGQKPTRCLPSISAGDADFARWRVCLCSEREADPIAMQFLQACYQTLCWNTPVPTRRSRPAALAAVDRRRRRHPASAPQRRQTAAGPVQDRGLRLLGWRAPGRVHRHFVGRRPRAESPGYHRRGSSPRRCCAGLPGHYVGHQDPRRVHRQPGRGRYRPCRRSSAWKTRCAAICRRSSSGTPWPTRLCRWKIRCCWPAP